jgi:hypothetical protein
MLPTSNPKGEFVHLAKTYARSSLRSRPLYGLIGHVLWEVYNKKTKSSEKSAIAVSQIYRTDLELAKNRLVRLDSMIDAQRSNADYFLPQSWRRPFALCHEPVGDILQPAVISTNTNRHRGIEIFLLPIYTGGRSRPPNHSMISLRLRGPITAITETAQWQKDCRNRLLIIHGSYHSINKNGRFSGGRQVWSMMACLTLSTFHQLQLNSNWCRASDSNCAAYEIRILECQQNRNLR